jgi:hypothetical protein
MYGRAGRCGLRTCWGLWFWVMEYNLDNRVELSTEREHKNLYSWSIKEFDEKGKQIGGDQIPWDWGLTFEVIELNPAYSLEMKGDVSGEEDSGSQPSEVKEYLYGKLLPSVEMRRAGIYSMFGTRRRIDQFGLFIYKTKEGESEYCRLWGSISYTSDWDFQNVTEPDCVQLYVYLAPENFDQLMNLVKLPVATGATIRLSGVAGFYSDWSPSIRTDSIKVLANAKDQQLKNPQNLTFDPPALGHVREFQISIKKEYPLILHPKTTEEDVEEEDLETNTQPLSKLDDAQFRSTILSQIASLKKNFGRLQLVLWLILVAVVLHLFK